MGFVSKLNIYAEFSVNGVGEESPWFPTKLLSSPEHSGWGGLRFVGAQVPQQHCDCADGSTGSGKGRAQGSLLCSILGQPSIAGVPERCPGQPGTQVPRGFHRHFLLCLPSGLQMQIKSYG